jgi:thiol:disulfide interchange protein DsbC
MLEQLKKANPATTFTSAQRSAIPGLWEVVMGQNIAYVDESGRYFLIGRLFDMQTKTDITAATKERIATRVEWSSLPLNDAIRFGTGSKRLAVFTDPDCPFCRQLEAEIEKLDDLSVYVFPYPITSLHPGAARTSQAIWCAPNKAAAWRDYLLRKVQPPAAKEGCAADAIGRNVALAERLGISATPTLIAPDGRMVSGASKAEQIKAWIEKGDRSAGS